MSLELSYSETPTTSYYDKVYVKDNNLVRQKVYYKKLSNQEQLNVIIESLVVKQGFLANQEKNGVFRFTSSTVPEVEYLLYTEDLEMEKVVSTILDTV